MEIQSYFTCFLQGHNEGELTISAGEELILVEEDDGSGWSCVSRGDEQGFVPTSYIQKH